MKTSRSPLKGKPLRNPGQSVREHRVDMMFDKLFAPILIAMLLLVYAGTEWMRHLLQTPPNPWLASIIALAGVAYAGWQFFRYVPKLRALRMAEEGEKAVGQLLDGLRTSGYSVFHDVVGEGFNVDHVLIGPAGVFSIETKTWSKPAKGSPEISVDGETLHAAGWEPDRNPIVQAKAQASWLQGLLEGSTGKSFPVRPVVLFPGWYVKDSRRSRKELWVLEPKALAAFLANEPPVVNAEDSKLATFHLSRFIREQERVLEARR